MNVPLTIGAVVANDKATLHELSTVYSLEDVYDLLEIIEVTNHNSSLASKAER